MRIRTFEALLDVVAGLPAETDAFGLGDVSLLTIETDGTYHDLDVLKIAAPGATRTGLRLDDATIAEAAAAPRIEAHRRLLRRDGLSAECRACLVVGVCGGGAVPHRYAADGFDHPTIYCREMKALIAHARRRVADALAQAVEDPSGPGNPPRVSEVELATFDHPVEGRPFVDTLRRDWKGRAIVDLTKALDLVAGRRADLADCVAETKGIGPEALAELAVEPSAVLWASVIGQAASARVPRTIDGQSIPSDPDYARILRDWVVDGPPLRPRIHRADLWLRHPFGDRIHFESPDIGVRAMPLIDRAFEIIGLWDPGLLDEMKLLSPEIQFIRDPSAHPEKAVSFSDNSVPGCLYVSVRRVDGWIGPYDLADSLVHEHRHQKLYLLQAYVPLLAADVPLVRSPWREEPRPPSGLLHAVFVFVGLLGFWRHVAERGDPGVRDYARAEVGIIEGRLREAFPTLLGTALTSTGRRLVGELFARVHAATT